MTLQGNGRYMYDKTAICAPNAHNLSFPFYVSLITNRKPCYAKTLAYFICLPQSKHKYLQATQQYSAKSPVCAI
jgi:hypothetical protein